MLLNFAAARRVATLTVTALVLAITTSVSGQTGTPRIMPPHSIVPPTPEGKSIGAWAADWWIWAMALPIPDDPLSDQTGANANTNQPDGPVFFIGSVPFGLPPVERTFTVPAGKYLLVHLAAGIAGHRPGDPLAPCNTPEECLALIRAETDAVDQLLFRLNDYYAENIFLYRETSPPFSIQFAEPNAFGYPGWFFDMMVGDGYWAMLEPLSEGQQLDLFIFGNLTAYNLSATVTAHITAVPADCNGNTIFDSCDIDCGEPGGPCDVPGCGMSTDCDGSSIPDECDADCWPTDAPNGIPDYCDVLSCPAGDASCADCNANRVPDECDTLIGFSQDCQHDRIPDDCQTHGAVSASWATGSGNWNVGANWCPDLSPDFPDNRLGTTYDVVIDGAGSLVTLNTSPSVNSLSLTGGATVVVNDASGANVRTLHSDGDITNGGVFRATDRERLILDAPLIDQGGQCGVGGALEATDGAVGEGAQADKSILEINGSRVLGGIARTIGQHSEIHLIGGAELVDVCIDGVVIPDGQTGAFSGTVTNDGIMSVRGTTLDTRLDPRSADAALEGAGRLKLTSQSFSRLGDIKASFTNSKSHRIEGGGIVYGGMINNGTVRADLPGQHLVLSPPGRKQNDGLFLATDGATLRLADDVSGSGLYEADGGSIAIVPLDEFVSVDGAAVRVRSDVVGVPGIFTVGPESALTLSDGITVEPDGVFEVTGNGIVTAGSLTIDGSADNVLCPDRVVAGGHTPPIIRIRNKGEVTVSGELIMFGAGGAANSSSENVSLGGDWDNQSACPAVFDWTAGGLALNGSGPQRFEVAGRDLGHSRMGFGGAADSNYSMGRVEIRAGGSVTFSDAFDNDGHGQTPCGEALYVHELTLGAGSAVTLDDCRVYYDFLIDNGGTITRIGCGDLQPLPTGDTNGDRRIDLHEWNLLGACQLGPGSNHTGLGCVTFDFDADGDIDLADAAWFQRMFNVP